MYQEIRYRIREYLRLSSIIKKLLNPVWGFDKDGDFALKIGPLLFIMYKWSDPTISKVHEGWAPLNDINSKSVWRYLENFKPQE